MGQYSGKAELAGIYKDKWTQNVLEVHKFETPIIGGLKLETGEEYGGLYHVPVVMQLEHGITHAAASTTPGQGSNAFIRPRAALIPDAKVAGVQTYLRAFVPYEAVMDSGNLLDGMSESKQKAVVGAVKQTIKNLSRSAALRLEALALHGGSPQGLGVIQSAGAEVAYTFEGRIGVYRDIVITAEEWCPGLMTYCLGATLDAYTALGVKANTVAHDASWAANLTTASTAAVVIGVEPNNALRTVRLWHSASGGLAGFTTAGNALFFESGGPIASGMREILGIDVMARCGSGETGMPTTLHQLDSAVYPLHSGNYVPAAGITRLDSLLQHMATPFNYGVMGATYRAVTSPKQFASLLSDESSLRRYADNARVSKQGFASLSFEGPGGNVVEIMGHPFQKEGKITCYPVDEVHRVGSQDISFIRKQGDSFALEVGEAAAGEIRAGGKFNLYSECNKHLLSINGVTY